MERGVFSSALAQPGSAAPDGRFEEGYFAERLQGEFTVAYFGGEGMEGLCVGHKGHDALFARYGVEDKATYVFRPDGHVLARCTGIDAGFAAQALERVTQYVPPEQVQEARSQQPASDRLFDRLSAQIEAMPQVRRASALAPVISRIEEQRGDLAGITGV